MRKLISFLALVWVTNAASAAKPEYFSDEIEMEYQAVFKHLMTVLPDSGKQIAYLGLLSPYNLLDVYPSKFSDYDKQRFANFHIGVVGRARLPLEQDQIKNLGTLALCQQEDCQQDRVLQIEKFLKAMSQHADDFVGQSDFVLLHQLTEEVYRINNTFITPAQAVTYYPSEHAGFVPSGDFEEHSSLDSVPQTKRFAMQSRQLRNVMNQHGVRAMAKTPSGAINVVFGGLGDNHWGVMIGTEDETLPSKGQLSPLGYAYDVVESIAPNAFYYQTN